VTVEVVPVAAMAVAATEEARGGEGGG
jgi:hypothetical protein